MSTGGGEALESAVGLQRTPALRTALRERPLPPGIGEVLAIAGGSREALHTAAVRTGYAEGELVDAARFYVQQVLLAPDADAYRVLGASVDSPQGTLRDHHRLLLRWLHPDRSEPGQQWESAMATRVNQAWSQLRTEGARARHDAVMGRQAEITGQGAAVVPGGPAGARGLATPAMATAAGPRGSGPALREGFPLGPVAVGLLALACVVLAWMAVQHGDPAVELRGQPPPAPRFKAREADWSAPAPRVPVLDGLEVGAPAPRDPPAVAALPSGGPLVEGGLVEGGLAEGAVAAVAPGPADGVGESGAGYDAHGSFEPAVTAAMDPVPPEDPLQLFHQAEDALHGVAVYLASPPGSTEPLWLDLPASLQGAGIRGELQQRHGQRRRGRMEIESPQWTLGASEASVHAAYRFADRRGAVESGGLHLRLERRGAEWRVAGLQLEPRQ